MAISPFATALQRMQTVASKALDKAVRDATGSANPDVQLYESLKPEHFQALIQKYGPDEIVQYIKDMEALKMEGA